MTMKAKTDLETIKGAMDDMTQDERTQFVSFVEGMSFQKGLNKPEEKGEES